MQLQGTSLEMSKGLYLDLNYYFQVGILLLTPQLKMQTWALVLKRLNQDTRVQSKAQEVFITHEHECVFLGLNPEIGS